MKNFPNQFNNLDTLFRSFEIARELFDNQDLIDDYNFGERLVVEGVYNYQGDQTPREYINAQRQKPPPNRGYERSASAIRRLLYLLGCLSSTVPEHVEITPLGRSILSAESEDLRILYWKSAFLNMGLVNTENEVSHPYVILLRLVNDFPGIQNKKLMLALEARTDSEEEYQRISDLATESIEDIRENLDISEYVANNAVKVLPAFAEQVGDIVRRNHCSYPVWELLVSEDNIETIEIQPGPSTVQETTAATIANEPNISDITGATFDLTSAIRKRHERLTNHEECVRILAQINENADFTLYKGRIDCLAVKNEQALIFEVKTILDNTFDQEKQSIKGVGQLKYYKFSIVEQHLQLNNNREILAFSRKPNTGIIDFCTAENIVVIWREGDSFQIFNVQTGGDENFDPDGIL